MEAQSQTPAPIHIVYHPTLRGYSCYSQEMDGLQTEATSLNELFQKVRHMLAVRIETLKEIGKDAEAKALKEKEIIFTED